MNQTEITIILIAVIVLAIGLRIWRAMREQRMKIAYLWVAPLLVALLAGWVLYVDGLTSPANIALAVVVLFLGAALGFYQGTHTTVRADRSAGILYVRTRPIGAAIVVIVIAARIVLRSSYILPAVQNPGSVPVPPRGDLVGAISSMLLVFAAGMITGLRIYLFSRYHASDVTPAS